ncbi:hypothetical protein LZ023_29000 [Pseudomonas silvicola]|nr:hypothetical protein LZ023_29000 [Pseudomonas silvicola]
MVQKRISVDAAWLARNGFYCKDDFVCEASSYLKTAFLGMLLALLASITPISLHADILQKAMLQGIGPELWNMAGLPGVVGVGLFFLFPCRRFVAEWAVISLMTAYSVGTLMTGVFAGWFLVEVPQALSVYGVGLSLLLGVAAIIALATCVLMNFFLWYLSWLIRRGSAFEGWMRGLKQIHRVSIGIFLMLTPAATFLLQSH